MAKFDTANEIVIQSGFRNPEFKDISGSILNSAPTQASDGVFFPDSERAVVFGTATSGNTFECAIWGFVKGLDEWHKLGTVWPGDSGERFFLPTAGAFERIVAVVPSSEQTNISSLNLGYPIDE